MTPAGPDWQKVATSLFTGLLGLLLVATACYESATTGAIDTALLALTSAVMATFFTGQAVRQVNGRQVDALTSSVMAVHARLDQAGISPAKDGAA